MGNWIYLFDLHGLLEDSLYDEFVLHYHEQNLQLVSKGPFVDRDLVTILVDELDAKFLPYLVDCWALW